MTLKTIAFRFLLILIICFLDVKSDTSHIQKNRENLEVLMQFIQDQNFRNNIITILETQEERIVQQRNQISQLRQAVEERVQRIIRARDKLATIGISLEQNLKDKVAENRLDQPLTELLTYINQLRTIRLLTNQERLENRNTLLRRLEDFIAYLDRTLSSYSRELGLRELRVQELAFFLRIEENLNVYELLDQENRAYEKRAKMPQIARDSLAKDLSLKDQLERTIRTSIETLRKRHEGDRPIDDEHKKEVKLLNDQWKNFSLLVDRIEKQRKQLQIFFQEQQNQVAQERTASQDQAVQIKRMQEQNLQEQQNAKRYKQGPAGEGPSGPKQGPGGQSRKY